MLSLSQDCHSIPRVALPLIVSIVYDHTRAERTRKLMDVDVMCPSCCSSLARCEAVLIARVCRTAARVACRVCVVVWMVCVVRVVLPIVDDQSSDYEP